MTINDEPQVEDIIIRSEEDAYRVLALARDGLIGPYGEIVFDGWPTLSLYLQGEKFHQSITPTVMRGLLEFQKGIYQSYASAKYENPAKRLSDEEKKALEIRVDVKDGSSDFEIDFQGLAEKLIDQLGGKMSSVDILIIVVSIAVLYFGKSAYTSYLEHRKEVRLKELDNESQLKQAESQLKQLETMQFASAQETERMKIMAGLVARDPRVGNIDRLAYDARSEVVKTLTAGDNGAIVGVQVSPEVADTLTTNARRKSAEVRLDGVYRLIKLDWADAMKFKVRVYNVETGLQLDAEVQDESLTGQYKEALRQAEWSRKPVALKINAKLLGEDSYRDAVVIAAEAVSEADG